MRAAGVSASAVLLLASLAYAQKPELAVQTGHTSVIHAVAFSPDGRTLASASGDHTVKLWDVVSGGELRSLLGHTDGVLSVAFSPDGRTLASGSSDKTIKLWDVGTGRELRRVVADDGEVSSIAFSPDGRTLASAGIEPAIKLWDVASGRELGRIGHFLDEVVTSVAFSPDGRTLALGKLDVADLAQPRQVTIELWDVTSLAGTNCTRLPVTPTGSNRSLLAPMAAPWPGFKQR